MAVSELPEDADEREREIQHRVGDWLQRRLRRGEFETSVSDVAEAVGLPDEDVEAELDRLVDDDVTPLKREGSRYVAEV